MKEKSKLTACGLVLVFVFSALLVWLVWYASNKQLEVPIAVFPYEYSCYGTTLSYSDYNAATGIGGNRIVPDATLCGGKN